MSAGLLVSSVIFDGRAIEGSFEQRLEIRPATRKSRSLTIRNDGPRGIRSPRILIGNQADIVSLDGIVGNVTTPGMTDREKAEALWAYVCQRSTHACPDLKFPSSVPYDPLFQLNELGYGCCGQLASALGALWKAAGLRTRLVGLNFHAVPEVFYEGDWHMYDPDHRVFYLLEDGRSVASVWGLACNPARVAAVPDPVGYDSAWMASKYESYGPGAQYSDLDDSYIKEAGFWLPAGSSLTFAEIPEKLTRSDLRPVDVDPDRAPEFSEAVFRGTLRFGDPSWPLFLRGTEIREGRLCLRAGVARGIAVLEVAGPGAALKGSLEIPYVVREGARLRIWISGDPDLPGWPLAEASGPASGFLRKSLKQTLGSLRARRFFVTLELEGADPSVVEVGPSLKIETVMQWSRSALQPLKEPVSVIRYRDGSGDVSRNLKLLVGDRPLSVTTPGGSDFWEWEASADDGRADWRGYLSKPADEIRKVLRIPESRAPGACELLSLVSGTAADKNQARFDAVFSLDGQVVLTTSVPNLEGIRWLPVPFDPALLLGKKDVEARISLRSNGDDATGYLEVFGSGKDVGGSSFNGQRDDLSRDPGMQRGEFMLRIRCQGPRS